MQILRSWTIERKGGNMMEGGGGVHLSNPPRPLPPPSIRSELSKREGRTRTGRSNARTQWA